MFRGATVLISAGSLPSQCCPLSVDTAARTDTSVEEVSNSSVRNTLTKPQYGKGNRGVHTAH